MVAVGWSLPSWKEKRWSRRREVRRGEPWYAARCNGVSPRWFTELTVGRGLRRLGAWMLLLRGEGPTLTVVVVDGWLSSLLSSTEEEKTSLLRDIARRRRETAAGFPARTALWRGESFSPSTKSSASALEREVDEDEEDEKEVDGWFLGR